MIMRKIIQSILSCCLILCTSACSGKPPKCSDDKVVSDVKKNIIDDIMQAHANLSGGAAALLFQVQQPRKHDAAELSLEQELEDLLSLKNIHADSYDENVKKWTCRAELDDGNISIPLIYESQLDDNGKQALRGGLDNVTNRDFNIFTRDAVAHTRSNLAAEATAIKQKIEKQLAGNLSVGEVVAIPSMSRFRLVTFGTDYPQQVAKFPAFSQLNFRLKYQHEFDPNDQADVKNALDSPSGVMDGPVTILDVHKDDDGIDDWYKASMFVYAGHGPRENNLVQVTVWIPREDLDNAGGIPTRRRQQEQQAADAARHQVEKEQWKARLASYGDRAWEGPVSDFRKNLGLLLEKYGPNYQIDPSQFNKELDYVAELAGRCAQITKAEYDSTMDTYGRHLLSKLGDKVSLCEGFVGLNVSSQVFGKDKNARGISWFQPSLRSLETGDGGFHVSIVVSAPDANDKSLSLDNYFDHFGIVHAQFPAPN